MGVTVTETERDLGSPIQIETKPKHMIGTIIAMIISSEGQRGHEEFFH